MAIVSQMTTSQFHVTLNASERKILTEYAGLTNRSRSQSLTSWLESAAVTASTTRQFAKPKYLET